MEFFFPSNIYCIACGNLIDETRPYSLCDKCVREINWITDNECQICGKDLGPLGHGDCFNDTCFECQEITHSFDRGYSCATYEGPVKEILSGLKYKGRSYYVRKMIDIMCSKINNYPESIEPDIILPVPMHPTKEKKRGYNQSNLLAEGLGKNFNIKYLDDVLVKTRLTASMSSLGSSERRINLHNTFAIGYNRENDVRDKYVLLVDDVYTTGSTADECAEVLKACGARRVEIFTFASGVNMKTKIN